MCMYVYICIIEAIALGGWDMHGWTDTECKVYYKASSGLALSSNTFSYILSAIPHNAILHNTNNDIQ